MSISLVEHVVFFKAKENVQGEKHDWIGDLNNLKSLDGVLHLQAGPGLNRWPAHSSLSGGFTHVLHSRYKDKAALASYGAHPAHVATVERFKPLVDDILAIDWETTVDQPSEELAFQAKRVVACKLKEGISEDDKKGLVDAITGRGTAKLTSFGPNFSPGRAKGFNFGFLSLYQSLGDLESPETLEAVKGNPLVDDLLVVDYACDGTAAAKM